MDRLWRRVLSVLNDNTLDDAEREAIEARGAAPPYTAGPAAHPHAVLDVAYRQP